MRGETPRRLRWSVPGRVAVDARRPYSSRLGIGTGCSTSRWVARRLEYERMAGIPAIATS